MSKKFTSTVAGASLLLASFGLLSRSIGFIREIVFASFFGLSKDFDIYLVGAVLPITIDTIIFYLGQNFFIPAFHNFSLKYPSQKEVFLRFNFWFFIFVGILISLLMYFFSNQIVNIYLGGNSIEAAEKVSNILRIFLITIPFATSISILSAFLQSEFNFTSPGVSRLFLNVSIIILVLLFADKFNIYIIPIGYIAGNIFQLIYLLKRVDINLFGNFFSINNIKPILKTSFLFTILIETISQLYIISDRYFMGSVDSGGIAALNYAQSLYLLPISIITIALSTALLPKLSECFSSGSFYELDKAYNDGIRINLFIFVPLTFIFFFFGDDLIKIIYQRGNFSWANTILTYSSLKYFALSFVFYSTFSISNKLMYSANLTKALLYVTITGIFIKIFFNFLLVDFFKQDGLAASTSISYFFFFISTLLIVKSKGFVKEIAFWQVLMFQLVNGVCCLFVSKIMTLVFWSNSSYSGYLGIIFFFTIYFINQMIVKNRSIDLVFSMLYRFIGKNPKSDLKIV